jgi:hypothetical protein
MHALHLTSQPFINYEGKKMCMQPILCYLVWHKKKKKNLAYYDFQKALTIKVSEKNHQSY